MGQPQLPQVDHYWWKPAEENPCTLKSWNASKKCHKRVAGILDPGKFTAGNQTWRVLKLIFLFLTGDFSGSMLILQGVGDCNLPRCSTELTFVRTSLFYTCPSQHLKGLGMYTRSITTHEKHQQPNQSTTVIYQTKLANPSNPSPTHWKSPSGDSNDIAFLDVKEEPGWAASSVLIGCFGFFGVSPGPSSCQNRSVFSLLFSAKN